MNLAARAAGVVVSPGATYADVSDHPRLWQALLLLLILMGAIQGMFLSTTVGKDALFDQQIQGMESFGMTVTPEIYEAMERNSGRAPVMGVVGQTVGLTVGALLVAGFLLGIFTAIMDGAATFTQVFAVVVHSGFILALQQLFGAPLNYVRGELGGASALGVFVPGVDQASLPGRLAWSIDLFIIWWLINLAIGVGVLYNRRSGPIATSFVLSYLVIAVIVSVIRSGSGA